MNDLYPCIKENSGYGAIALFTSEIEGVLLYKGSSWLEEGSIVSGEGFDKKLLKVTLTDKSSIDERELIFLKACSFDVSCGYWGHDVTRYKAERPFFYEYVMGYGKSKETTQDNNIMTNQCKFKEGDQVKKINGTAFSNGEFVVTVEGMEEDYGKVWLKETQSWLDKDSLCLVQPFTKSDLKDGMVVTYRDKTERIVFDRKLYSTAGENYNFLRQISLDDFYDDLSCDHRSYDIMKVTYMDEILWEREEESEEDKKIKKFATLLQDTLDELGDLDLKIDIDKARKVYEELNKLIEGK